jgi:hypothetical protein
MLGKMCKIFFILLLVGWVACIIFGELGYKEYLGKAIAFTVANSCFLAISLFGYFLNQPFVVRIDDSSHK